MKPLPRDISRCVGSAEHQELCDRCARLFSHNNDPHGERVVYTVFMPYVEQKLSGSVSRCVGHIRVAQDD
jgi:hypothetical protein